MAKRKGSTIRLRGQDARDFIAMLGVRLGEPVARSCRICGCTDHHACQGGCTWTGDALCSACTPGVGETLVALYLVSDTTHITYGLVGTWTLDQRADAYVWAMAVHHRASDNNVDVPPRPDHTIRPALGPE